jgi:hypothetical protein
MLIINNSVLFNIAADDDERENAVVVPSNAELVSISPTFFERNCANFLAPIKRLTQWFSN